MSGSYRTERINVIAAQRFSRDREGNGILPRVIERSPRPGDVHPLKREHIEAFLWRLPIACVYGLKRIELLPRRSVEIGEPLGCYLPREKAIQLFSVPPADWHLPDAKGAWRCRIHDARVEDQGDGVNVRWTTELDLAYFMYREVLLHELGHHLDFQYRHKRKLPQTRGAHETSAIRHARNLAERATFDSWFNFAPPE